MKLRINKFHLQPVKSEDSLIQVLNLVCNEPESKGYGGEIGLSYEFVDADNFNYENRRWTLAPVTIEFENYQEVRSLIELLQATLENKSYYKEDMGK